MASAGLRARLCRMGCAQHLCQGTIQRLRAHRRRLLRAVRQRIHPAHISGALAGHRQLHPRRTPQVSARAGCQPHRARGCAAPLLGLEEVIAGLWCQRRHQHRGTLQEPPRQGMGLERGRKLCAQARGRPDHNDARHGLPPACAQECPRMGPQDTGAQR